MEYKCTRVETVKTTINIVYVRASTESVQFISNRPECVQLPREETVTSPVTRTLKRVKRYVRAAHIETITKEARRFQLTSRLHKISRRKLNSGRKVKRTVMVLG